MSDNAVIRTLNANITKAEKLEINNQAPTKPCKRGDNEYISEHKSTV